MIVIPELKSSPNELRNLQRYLSKIVGDEFSKITTACYYPKFIKYWNEIQIQTGIKLTDIKNFSAGFEKEYYSNFKSISSDFSGLTLIGIIYYSRIKQYEVVRLFYYLLALRFYSNFIHKYMKFCKPEAFDAALSKISDKHLFKVRNGISNSIMYLANIELEKQYPLLSSNKLTDESLLKLIYSLRHRINQSFKSFSNQYYLVAKEIEVGTAGGEKRLDITDEISNIVYTADKISMSINTYGQVDGVALKKAISFSGIRQDVADDIVVDMSIVDHKQKVYFLIILMHKMSPIENWCTEPKRLTLVRKVLADNLKINKYSIKSEIISLIESFENYYKLKTLNKNQLVVFIMHYITLYVRNRYCR